MPVAVAGQLMAVPVDFLYGIPVGLDHSARHKKGRFDVHGIQHIKASGQSLMRAVLTS